MGLGNSLQTAQGAAGGGGVGVGGWVELARTTNGTQIDSVTVAGFADKQYYMVLNDLWNDGNIANFYRTGNGSVDTGSNYAQRREKNGGADTTQTSASYWQGQNPGTNANNRFGVGYLANLSAQEKLFMFDSVSGNNERTNIVGKWANTSNPLDQFAVHNVESGSYLVGSEVVVLGWDPTDTHTTNFWTELASVELGGSASEISSGTIAAKKYLWLQCYIIADGSVNDKIQFNNDTSTNYKIRYSGNGAADTTGTGQTSINVSYNTSATNKFLNYFISNDAADVKILVGNTVNDGGSDATTTPDRVEATGIWTNTSDQITEIDVLESGGGSYAAGSVLKVWGSD